jgi:hypothetical protein
MNRTAHIIPVQATYFVLSFSGPNINGSTLKGLPIHKAVGRLVYDKTLTKMVWIHMSRSQTTSAIADAVDRHNESAPADQQIHLKSIATRSYSTTSPCPFYNLIKKQDDHTSWEFDAAAMQTESTSDSGESDDESDVDNGELRNLQLGYLEMIETDEEDNVADIVAEMARLNNELDAIMQVERCDASTIAKTNALYQSMAALQARVAARGRLSPPF